MNEAGTLKIVLIAHKTHLPQVDALRVVAEQTLCVQTLYCDAACRRHIARGLDDPALIVLWDDDLAKTLATIRLLRRYLVEEPILVVTLEQNEKRLVKMYAAGVDECIDAAVARPLMLAKLRAWLRWACQDTDSPDAFSPLA